MLIERGNDNVSDFFFFFFFLSIIPIITTIITGWRVCFFFSFLIFHSFSFVIDPNCRNIARTAQKKMRK